MRKTYKTHQPAWMALLARPAVTLVCFCAAVSQCHPYLLAEYLTGPGADYRGERSLDRSPFRGIGCGIIWI